VDSLPAVKDTLSPADFVARIGDAARLAGFRAERFGEIDGVPLLALTRRTPGPRPRIYLSAGIHGDEPAPPHTLLTLLENGFFDRRANWFLCPLLNPAGFLRRTRENASGIDLNRDYRAPQSPEIQAHCRWLRHQPNFDLALCLHEDWESHGFYLYELNPAGVPGLAREIVSAVAPICPIETAEVIDGRPIDEPGIIRPIADPLLRETWPESIYLREHHARLGYTLETPSRLPLALRIAALGAAVAAAFGREGTR
jgi:hypothetical protein